MSLTPNFGFNIPTGTDIVNLLTQCYPNFTSLDSILKAIKDTGTTVCTCTKVGTVFQLVRTDSDCNVMRFVATGNYQAGDTFTIDGVSVTATAVDGTSMDTGAFVINQNVIAILNGSVLTVMVKGGGASTAQDVSYDNTGSGLTATNVQDAIDEVKADIPSIPATYDADDIVYDNIVSGLTATDVQAAIDELASNTGEKIVVSGDGVKTMKQLCNEIYAQLDATKLTYNSTIVIDYTSNTQYLRISQLSPTVHRFMGTSVPGSSGITGTFIDITSNSTVQTYTGNSVSDHGSYVLLSGGSITLNY